MKRMAVFSSTGLSNNHKTEGAMFASRVELTKSQRNVSSLIIPSRTLSKFIFWVDQGHFMNLNFTDFVNEHKNFIC